jgi:hypothetical protein
MKQAAMKTAYETQYELFNDVSDPHNLVMSNYYVSKIHRESAVRERDLVYEFYFYRIPLNDTSLSARSTG